jgi:hypothetical protein
MRKTLVLALAALALDAAAQSAARPLPPGARPLEEPPPPPAIVETDPALEERAVVTTRVEGDSTITEYRVKNKVFMQKVTPRHGKPYVLIDNNGDGTFTKLDNTLDAKVRVPQWVLLEF